jgi:hypothetical protein
MAYAGIQGQGVQPGRQGSIAKLKVGKSKTYCPACKPSYQLSRPDRTGGSQISRTAGVTGGRKSSMRASIEASQQPGSKCIDCRGAALAAGMCMQVRVRCRCTTTLPCTDQRGVVDMVQIDAADQTRGRAAVLHSIYCQAELDTPSEGLRTVSTSDQCRQPGTEQ